MTVKELQNECLKNGISVAKTKKHFIALRHCSGRGEQGRIPAELEKLDPNPAKPHFMLKGKELQLKINLSRASRSNEQFGIGKLKPKSMLIDDLQKALSTSGERCRTIDKKVVHAVEEALWGGD